MFVGMPENLNAIDTSEGWFEEGQKLIVHGTVFRPDQKTAAESIIIYYYHTDQKGYYSPGDKTDAGSRRNGRLRGWVKTGPDGTYSIYTSRPAQYPTNNTEAHIHILIKEPDLDKPYWTDAWVFDDDPLLTPSLRQRLENRGGSGIMKTRIEGDVQVAQQDVILGLNIPGYPE
jgi:protocatechuate 3,4-dioxygenase beta subunit